MSFPTNHNDLERSKIIYIKSAGVFYPIDVYQLNWIVAKGNYCTIFMNNASSYIVRYSLSNLLTSQSLGTLIQIHRNYVINYHKIRYYNPLGTVKIGDEEIPVSKKYKNKLEEKLQFFKPADR